MKLQKKYLTGFQLSHLFASYKYGCQPIRYGQISQYGQKAIDRLVRQKYLIVDRIKKSSLALLTPTEKGINMVKQQFETSLRTGFLYHIYPLLIQDDVINVSKTLTNDIGNIYVDVPNRELPEGDYLIKLINKYTLHIIPLVNDNTLYKLKTYAAKDFLSLVLPSKINVQEEISKRFGMINVKALSRKLLKSQCDNFKVLKLINRIYKTKAFESRIIRGDDK